MSKDRTILMRGLRVIGSYIAMHPKPFAIAVGGATVYAAATVASAVVFGRVTDEVIFPAFDEGVDGRAALIAAASLLAVALIRSAAIVVRRFYAGMTGARVRASLQTRVVEKYRELPLAFYRARPAGELLAHADADTDAATEILHPLPFSTAAVLLIVFAIGALVLTDPFLAGIGLVVLPILTILNRIFGRRIEPPATRAQQRIGDVSAVAHESFDGALVVKTLGLESREVHRLADKADELKRERIHFGWLRAGFEPAFEALPNLGIIVLLAVGSWRVSTGDVTVGTLVQFVSLFQLLAFPMRLIGWVFSDIPRAVVGRERLEVLFSEGTRLPAPASASRIPPGPLGIQVDDVWFSYEDHPVLSGVSFDVAPDESVAIVGQTGSGKSTLAHLLVRLADPDRGSVKIGEIDLKEVEPDDLRSSTAVVFQESFLFAASIRDNIALELDVSDDAIVRAATLARAHEFISELPQGYDTVVGERGVTLSGGQRQRVALARALVRDPRVLILDDATSAVDATVEAEILEALRHQVGCTLVVIAYRLSTITLAERVFFLEGGRIAATGTHTDLLAHPTYDAMVRAYERAAV